MPSPTWTTVPTLLDSAPRVEVLDRVLDDADDLV
jgi:hypothetical protein